MELLIHYDSVMSKPIVPIMQLVVLLFTAATPHHFRHLTVAKQQSSSGL